MKFQISIIILLNLTLLWGCTDNQINPLEEDSGVYSFYGTVEVGKSTNIVRVKDLNDAFLADSAGFNGVVTFEDLETGEVTIPRDSVVKFSAGFTHNFIIEEEIKHSKSYLLRAERSDGLVGESIATTPAKTNVTLSPDATVYDCGEPITFRFENVVPPEFIDLRISVLYENERKSADMRYFLPYFARDADSEFTQITLRPHNLLVEVFPPESLLNNPVLDPFSVDPTVGCGRLDSDQMDITYTHYGSEWAAARPIIRGLINFDTGDVTNGLGIFGGFYRNAISLTIE